MTTALVLSMHNLGESTAQARRGPQPGGELPYGMGKLGSRLQLVWNDAAHRGAYRSLPARAVYALLRQFAPGWQGIESALSSRREVGSCDVVLSVFENAGLGFARVQVLNPTYRGAPHVMLTCWLSEDCQQWGRSRRRSVRRSMRSVARVVVFSPNQIPILQEFCGIDPRRVAVVPFGVDTAYYDPALERTPSGGGGLVSVGSDSRRDYATLFDAVRIADRPLTVACRPRNLEGLEVPSQVTVVHNAYGEDYRRLLHTADLVVTSTVAPAYPCGQSVVLEAMSMGRPTLTTDSAAMRHYVSDGEDGALCLARDPEAMAASITELMEDPGRRLAIGAAAAAVVRTRFSIEAMWDAVADVVGQTA